MNKELFVTSIIATLGVTTYYILTNTFSLNSLPVFLIILTLIFSYTSSFIRYVTPLGVIFSFIAVVYPFISNPPLFLTFSLLLGIVALAISWIWEFLLLILTFTFFVFGLTVEIPSLLTLNSDFFFLAMLSALGFANLRASTGKGYPAEVKVEGLPKGQTWYAEVNRSFIGISSNSIKDKKLEITFCPQFLSGSYYIPDTTTVSVKEGKKKRVHFSQSSSLPPVDKFPHCFAYFQAKGLPTNINWSIIVNNIEYSSSTSSLIIVPMFISITALWSAKEISVGGVVFRPIAPNGVVKRGDKVIIEYTSIVQQFTQQSPQKPLLPPLDKWDPKVWIGRDLYGYRVLSVLGSGGNGYVLKAQKDNSLYAIKVFSIAPSSNVTMSIANSFDQIFKESETLKNLSQNPKFVRIYGIYVDTNNIKSIIKGNSEIYFSYPPAIIMEYMVGGTALNLMESQISYSNYWPFIVRQIVKEVAEALSFLHSNGFVHLDVKPENIFFSRDLGKYPEEVYKNVFGNVRLGDLGSAVRIGERIMQATPSYCPPDQVEAVITGKGANPKMDVFALGMTAYVLLTLRKDNPVSEVLNHAVDLYINSNVGGALKDVQQAKQILYSWRPNLPQNTPQDLANIILRSLNVNPNYRPSADEIVRSLS